MLSRHSNSIWRQRAWSSKICQIWVFDQDTNKAGSVGRICASELTWQMYADSSFYLEITSFSFLWNRGRSCQPFQTTNIWIYEHATHIFVWGGQPSQVLPLLKLTDILGRVSCLFPNVKPLGTFAAKRMLMGYFWEHALSMENTGAKKCIPETHLSTLGASQSIVWWEAGQMQSCTDGDVRLSHFLILNTLYYLPFPAQGALIP